MARERGRLPGRFVNAHLRKDRCRPGSYLKVADYQERVHSPLARRESFNPQGEFELSNKPLVAAHESPEREDEK